MSLPEKKRIGIVGLGAIGAWVYSHLAELPDRVALYVLADTDRVKKLKSDGVVINGRVYQLNVRDFADSAPETLDYLIIASKMPAYPEILAALTAWVSEGTQILPLQNGITSETLAAELYGWDRVIHGIARIDSQRRGNEVYFNPAQADLVIGEAQVSALAPQRVAELGELLTAAGLQVRQPEDIIRAQWLKFLSNCTVNQSLAILDVSYGALLRSPELLAFIEALGHEIVALGQAEGVDIGHEDVSKMLVNFRGLGDNGLPSTLQDLRAKRPTEVDTFAGECIRLGEKHKLPVPLSQAVYQMLRVLEQKNAGLLPY